MKESEKFQAMQWVDIFHRTIKADIGSITNKICPTGGISLNDCYDTFVETIEKLADEKHMDELVEFDKDLTKLSDILDSIKASPKNPINKVRGILYCEEKALDVFIEACTTGIVWTRAKWAKAKEQDVLHARMTYCFAQAYK
ncbi:unnamed protein product [marine sediment metagenome]|uniref:Uncharacterized protein n=1 Tax=marine sediment metagenome TaxID=412755 RepID=X1U122_9ZZZZ